MNDLERENKVKADIEAEFGGAVANAVVQRKNRVWLECAPEKLPELMAWLKAAGFNNLATITGFDEGENFGAFYHATDTHMLVNVKVKTPKTAPSLPSVLKTFPGALSYERELEDMFGIKIAGLPPGRRYPLPDDFPTDQYPLRKDWKFVAPAEETEAK